MDAAPAPAPAADTRTRIVRAAAELFAAHGYHAVGMSALQGAVGLGRGALYHHIRSKEDLLYEITRTYLSELLAEGQAMADAAPPDCLRALGEQLLSKIASHQAELTVCFREVHALTEPRHGEVMSLHRQYEGLWRAVLERGADQGCFRPYDPVVLKGLLGMYFYSYLWIRPQGPLGPARIAGHFHGMALRMLAPD